MTDSEDYKNGTRDTRITALEREIKKLDAARTKDQIWLRGALVAVIFSLLAQFMDRLPT